MDGDSAGSMVATVNWLEVEQRDVKDRFQRLQQLVEHMNTMLQDQGFRLQGVEETVDGLKYQSGKLPALEEDLRQIKEKAGQVQESHSDLSRVLDRLERSKKGDDEATRDAIRGLTRSVEELLASGESLVERNRSQEAALKRQQEQMDWLRGQHDDLRKSLEPLVQSISFSQEQSRRLHERVEQLALEMDPLRRQDEVIQTKLEVSDHQAKQMNQRLDSLSAEFQARKDLPERLDVQKANVERVERQTVQALQLIQKLSEAAERQTQHVREVEIRAKSILDQVVRVQQRAQDVQTYLEDTVAALGELLEMDKRRQIADLEGQLRGIKERMARIRGAALTQGTEAS